MSVAQLKRAAPGAAVALAGGYRLGKVADELAGAPSADRGRSFTSLTAKHPMATADRNAERRRTTATARIREVWDCRLRQSERELVLEFVRVPADQAGELAVRAWSALDEPLRARIFIGLRDLAQLGNEASYALGYSRRT